MKKIHSDNTAFGDKIGFEIFDCEHSHRAYRVTSYTWSCVSGTLKK